MRTLLVMLFMLFAGGTSITVDASSPPAVARRHQAQVVLDRLTATTTTANVHDKVVDLALQIDRGGVTVEEFTDYYFRRTSPGVKISPGLRQRFVRNMQENFRAMMRQKGSVRAMRGRRAVEVVLLRLAAGTGRSD